jgi:hypothetical protein
VSGSALHKAGRRKDLKQTKGPAELWDDATALGIAWLFCAEPSDNRRYRTTEDSHKRQYIQNDLKIDLSQRLAAGELAAYGLRVGAPLSEGPVEIPRRFFPTNVNDAVEVNWEASTVESAGHTFVQVRVSKERPLTADHGQIEHEERRMGRPSEDAKIREILQQLKAEGWRFDRRLQKETCQKILEIAQARGFDTKTGYSDPVLKRLIREIRDKPA